ncbi:hypothetical protein IL306_012459 [Fusarium sp. DS 682]|nr:hypothetical protein IL306_012459 [Fusarium sp. DS 682]
MEESPDMPTSQLDEESSITVSTTAVSTTAVSTVESSGDISIQMAPTTTKSAPADKTSSSDNETKSSSTPTGPIVGSVIGGLALIALVGFAVWFVRRKNPSFGAVPSHRDSNVHLPANYHHSQPQYLPDHDSLQYSPLSMSSTPRNGSQNFSNLAYPASPQASELPSTTGRPKTPEP